MSQTPKTLLCAQCGRKPKRYTIAWGYGNSNNEFTMSCDHGQRQTTAFVRVPNPLKQWLTEQQVIEQWNALQVSEPRRTT